MHPENFLLKEILGPKSTNGSKFSEIKTNLYLSPKDNNINIFLEVNKWLATLELHLLYLLWTCQLVTFIVYLYPAGLDVCQSKKKIYSYLLIELKHVEANSS